MTVQVRPGRTSDVPALLELWSELSSWRSRDRGTPATLVDSVQAKLVELIEDPGSEVLVALAGEEPVGMTILAASVLGPLSELPALQMSYLVVSNRFRGRGAGRALVAAAAAYAKDRRYDQILVDVLPGLRDTNRFFARLGFAPMLVRRAAPVAGLQRRLAVTERGAHAPEMRRRAARLRLRALPRPAPSGPSFDTGPPAQRSG